jgi:4-amino-4-deoxy-L-arabinose transferase-like glycosyltransferase
MAKTCPYYSAMGQRTILLTIFGLWLLLYASFTLFRPALLDDADSVHAEVAREMVETHDWITLHANGIRYLEKAPLLYWSMAASFTLFGPETWAARLPMALAALALFLTTYLSGRRWFASEMAGFYAAVVLLTSFGIFIFTRILIPDVMVCLWLTVAMLMFHISLQHPSRWTAWGFAVACALNVLTKGLIGVVFPVGIVMLFLLLYGRLEHLRRWYPVSSAAVFLVIAAPWHIAAGIANPSFWWFYFINEHVLRYLNRRVPRDYDTVPLFLFWGLLVVWLTPWIAFLRFRVEDKGRALLVLWAASVMVFFSFSTRQEYYSLPALPPLAVLIGGWMAEEESHPGRRLAVWLFVLGASGGLIAAYLAWHAQPPAPGVDISTLLTQNPGDYALSLGHFLDLSARTMGVFRLPLMLTAVALLVGTLLNLILRSQSKVRMANYALVTMMVLFLVAAHMALVTFSPVLSSKVLADAIRSHLQRDDVVEINGEYEAGSTLGFYLQRQVRILNGRSSDLWYGSTFKDAPRIFDDDATFRKLWDSSKRVFLWTEPGKMPAVTNPVYVLAQSGGKEIVSNQQSQ